MNEKLRKIINHYGLNKQLKYFQSEIFELNEAIISEQNNGCLENVIDSVLTAISPLMGTKHVDYKKEHIKEEIADAMSMLYKNQEKGLVKDKDLVIIHDKGKTRIYEHGEDITTGITEITFRSDSLPVIEYEKVVK